MAFDKLAYGREYARRHRAQQQARTAEHRKANKALWSAYSRVYSANKRAKFYGAPGILTLEDVQAVLAVGVCSYCGSTEKIEVDHVIPLHAGGANERSNIVPCCRPCNQSKQRADRPGRWSQHYDSCQRCGTAERRHISHGMCKPCYRADRHVPRQRAYATAPPNLQCDQCGKAFHLKPSSIRKGRGRYCSLECRWMGATPARLAVTA